MTDHPPSTKRSRIDPAVVADRLRRWLVPALDAMVSRYADPPNIHYGSDGVRVSVLLREGMHAVGRSDKAWIGFATTVAEAYDIALTEATRPADYESIGEDCSCGRTHDAQAWEGLRLVEVDTGETEFWMETRICECGRHIQREIPVPAHAPTRDQRCHRYTTAESGEALP